MAPIYKKSCLGHILSDVGLLTTIMSRELLHAVLWEVFTSNLLLQHL